MKLVSVLAIMAVTSILLIGCKKEGPAGPAGNANVLSNTFAISSWSYSSPSFYTDLNFPDLNSSNINTAAVMVYFSSGGDWTALPFTQYNSPSNYFMGFSTIPGNIRVTWTYDTGLSSGNNPNIYYSKTTVQLKIVVIPPSARKANLDLNFRNYKAVKNRFNLKE